MSLAVAVDGSASFRASVGETLATLPLTFASLVDVGPGVAVVLDGAGDWVAGARAARDAGASGILILEPQPVGRDGLAAFADESRDGVAPVRLARQWAGDPAVAALTAHERSDDETTLIDSQARLTPHARLDHLLVSQIDLVQVAAAGRVRLDTLTRNASGYIASGELIRGAQAHPLLLTGALTSARAPRAAVRELLFAGRRAVLVGDGRVARASSASISDTAGDRTLPTVYESAYRVAFTALAADIVAGAGGTADIDAYLTALDSARTLEGIAR